MGVHLVNFRMEDIERIVSWFDPETQDRLGGRDWIRRAPFLLKLTIGDEFRGRILTGRRMCHSGLGALLAPVAAPAAAVGAEAVEVGKDVEGVASGHDVLLECG
jgi:hypothetical protein